MITSTAVYTLWHQVQKISTIWNNTCFQPVSEVNGPKNSTSDPNYDIRNPCLGVSCSSTPICFNTECRFFSQDRHFLSGRHENSVFRQTSAYSPAFTTMILCVHRFYAGSMCSSSLRHTHTHTCTNKQTNTCTHAHVQSAISGHGVSRWLRDKNQGSSRCSGIYWKLHPIPYRLSKALTTIVLVIVKARTGVFNIIAAEQIPRYTYF